MLKFSIYTFFKEKNFVRENKEYLNIYGNIHPIFNMEISKLSNFLTRINWLKLPLSNYGIYVTIDGFFWVTLCMLWGFPITVCIRVWLTSFFSLIFLCYVLWLSWLIIWVATISVDIHHGVHGVSFTF
jgi:hypothetical protein